MEVKNNGLQTDEMIDILYHYLKDRKRIKHSISTASFMSNYAKDFGIDEYKAYQAGIFHDIAKEFDSEKMIKYAESFQKRGIEEIKYFDFKKKNSFLLHGFAAAEIIYTDLKIDDIELLAAVAHHTTGGTNLSLLAKYTFICDFCEPERSYAESKKVEKTLIKKRNMPKAYFLTYCYLIESLLERKYEMCLESVDGYNESLKLLSEDQKKLIFFQSGSKIHF
jgi:predicted HD superfamily hydrolase involved in NAD metabolism